MREIKFRAWDKRGSSMIDCHDVASSAFLTWDENIYEIMQYTGLKDKNGVLIYEGDICEGLFENDLGVVKYKGVMEFTKEAQFAIRFDDVDDTLGIYPSLNSSPLVIGNIYENPELLK